jgi:hypothetical protein
LVAADEKADPSPSAQDDDTRMTLMTNTSRILSRTLSAAAISLTLAGCQLEVVNPGLIDAATFDPGSDASTISLSAQTRFWSAFGTVAFWQAYFSGETWAGAARLETSDVGRRAVTSSALDVAPVWSALQSAIASNELAIRVLVDGANAATDINLARVYMNSGFALELMAETSCQGVILTGPPLTVAGVLDTAITRFKQAIAVATAIGTSNAEAVKIVNASNVGLGRAYLQKKDYANAATTAALVPATFVYNGVRIDDASNRGLGNTLYASGVLGTDMVVATPYRLLNDPRVVWTDAGRTATDGILRLYREGKYVGYANPYRIASGLEASYIAAEASLMGSGASQTAALALIAARRAAGNQPAFGGGTNAVVLAELMDQRARDFWLEAKHLGDWQRNPAATPYVPATGTAFYKPTQGNFGNATCFPVPDAEINANPNWPKP